MLFLSFLFRGCGGLGGCILSFGFGRGFGKGVALGRKGWKRGGLWLFGGLERRAGGGGASGMLIGKKAYPPTNLYTALHPPSMDHGKNYGNEYPKPLRTCPMSS